MQLFKQTTILLCLTLWVLHAWSANTRDKAFNLGKQALDEEPKAAIQHFTQALKQSDESWRKYAECLALRGEAYLKQKEITLAASDFQNAYNINPDMLAPLKGMVKISFAQKSYQQALTFSDRALEIDDQDAEMHYIRGRLYLMNAQVGGEMLGAKIMETAFEELTEAIKIDPNYVEAHFHRGLALILYGDQNMGMQDMRNAIKINPRLYQAHFELAKALFLREEWIQCLSHLDQALEIKPDHYPSLTMIVPVLVKRENLDRVKSTLQYAVDKYPNDGYLRAWASRFKIQPKSLKPVSTSPAPSPTPSVRTPSTPIPKAKPV